MSFAHVDSYCPLQEKEKHKDKDKDKDKDNPFDLYSHHDKQRQESRQQTTWPVKDHKTKTKQSKKTMILSKHPAKDNISPIICIEME